MSQWSVEQSVAEYGDLQASAMAVDCTGQWAVLAGRKTLTLVDLDNTSEIVTKLTRQSKFDVSCVQCHPYPVCGDLFAIACNQRVELFSWKEEDSSISLKSCLRAHSRTVSDLDWSPFDINIIASCSVDSYTYLWDVSDPKKPIASFQTVAGASQVKWNKMTNNLFATTHEGDVRLWDPREKGGMPSQYIAAHLSKIHGLDWSPENEKYFATSSQDGTVKFWDTTNPRHNVGIITSGSPVWRARYTPFGHGLITAVVPQLRRGENSLYLWNYDNSVAPVLQFIGHQDVILEFQWRKQCEGLKDYHLVTWSKDQSLRTWKIGQQVQKLCGHDVGDISDSSENESLQFETNGHSLPNDVESIDSSRQMSVSPDIYAGQKQRTLEEEFAMVNVGFDNVRAEMDPHSRACIVTGISGTSSIRILLQFPEQYPYYGVPSVEIVESSMNKMAESRINKVLKDTITKCAKRNVLEPLIRAVATTLESLPINYQPEERITPDTEALPPFPNFYYPPAFPRISHRYDANIPFPRTSGARFCAAGCLVTFGRSKEAKKGHPGTDFTPKAMSDLNNLVHKNKFIRPSHQNVSYNFAAFSRSPPTTSQDVKISDYYFDNPHKTSMKHKYRSQGRKSLPENRDLETKKPSIAPVKIYDSSRLLAINKVLGEQYLINPSDISTMCKHNSNMAANVGRKDLVQLWSLLTLMGDERLQPSDNPDDEPPWGSHPFGRSLLQSLIQYYIKLRDVQTLAMICCVFWTRQEQEPGSNAPPKPQQSVSMDYTTPSNNEASYSLGSSTDSGWNVLRKSSTVGIIQGDPSLHHLFRTGHYNPYHTISSMSNLVKGLQTHPVSSKLADIVNLLSPPTLSEVSSHPSLPELIHPSNQGVMKLRRSNSYSGFEIDSMDNDFKIEEDVTDSKERQEKQDRLDHENNCRMLDPVDKNKYDEYLRCYANILRRWGLHNQSREIMKLISRPPPEHRGLEFSVYCYNCNQPVRGSQCLTCKYPAFNCTICHLGVKGLSSFCLSCGHGGHTAHLTEWFKTESECPSGCGCQCLKGQVQILN